MTRSQLVTLIAERAPHVAHRDIERIVEAVFATMTEALRSEKRIEIRGFGSFAVRVRDARDARNPRTGEPVRVPRRVTPHFTPGKELRDRINKAAPSADAASEGPDRIAG